MDELDDADKRLISRLRETLDLTADRAGARLGELRERFAAVDVAVRIYERDKNAAGTLLGSALALRLFLFFVPLSLFVVGVAGILGRPGTSADLAGSYGISGTIAQYIDTTLDQNGKGAWLAATIGLFGIATTGRSLSRALMLSSALSWGLGGKQKVPVRATGIIVGIMVSVAFAAALLNRIRLTTGLAVTSMSFLGVTALYVVAWLLLYQTLPRSTTDPGASLPGATMVALLVAALQAFTQLYLPHRLESASAIYGSLGVLVAFLGWFFLAGRTIAFSFAVNAVLYEHLGSVSHLVFGLPVVRQLPRRVPAVARFFALDATTGREEPSDDAEPNGPG
jgi:uncharacterized BrkB/YihY/UPF0761 family membrane protein